MNPIESKNYRGMGRTAEASDDVWEPYPTLPVFALSAEAQTTQTVTVFSS